MSHEIQELGEIHVTTVRDAESICEALEWVRDGHGRSARIFATPLHTLTALFQTVVDPECAALPVLRERGMSLLGAIFDGRLSGAGGHADSDLLLVLKLLAHFGTADGTTRVIEAARAGFQSDDYMWTIIFCGYLSDHPQASRLFAALSDPIPQGFIAVALLDAANAACRAESSINHPFDSPAGVIRLRQWLMDRSEDRVSYAQSAAASLPCLRQPGLGELLNLALASPSADVRLEAAWAEARMRGKSGVERLASFALDVNCSAKALHYLEELDMAEAIPSAALTADFQARAEFALWLAHPCELGRAPDEVEVADRRELRWPPEFASKTVWLLRYRVRHDNGLDDDDSGVGMVGTQTFCFFSYELEQRPAEDGYAVHCSWELEQKNLLKFEDVTEGSTEYDSLLTAWHGPALTGAKVVAVVEVDGSLRLGQGLCAIAEVARGGRSGWAILGDNRGQFYASDEFPANESAKTVLKIDLGRRLLGFPPASDRAIWLRPKLKRPAAEIVAAYERELAAFRGAAVPDKIRRLGRDGVLKNHYESYLNAVCAVRGGVRAAYIAALYGELFATAKACDPNGESKIFDTFTVLGEQFSDYVTALVELGRREEVRPLVEFFGPHWLHNLGYRYLGAAAFKAGFPAVAEPYLLNLKADLDEWYRCEEMSMLARIWHARGEADRSRRLLLDAMQANITKNRETTGTDRKLYEEAFQLQRQTFLELFVDGATEPVRENIFDTTAGRDRGRRL